LNASELSAGRVAPEELGPPPLPGGGVSRPIIGLTTYLEQAQTGVWDVPASFLPKVYFEAVNRAGGIAVLLPPQPVDDAIANRVLDGLDGLIVTGGKDVEATRYGEQPHPANDAPRRDRDAWEDALLGAAIERGIPFLGICRGMQLLNVHLGGTLEQHLPDLLGTDRYNLGDGRFNDNEVEVEAGSRLGALVGQTVVGKSYHHQGIKDVGEGLVVSARTDDGVIQALELPDRRYGIAVQWHPEQDAEEDARLFEGLVQAAREYRA
jgi:putative glutamine amidotransferase